MFILSTSQQFSSVVCSVSVAGGGERVREPPQMPQERLREREPPQERVREAPQERVNRHAVPEGMEPQYGTTQPHSHGAHGRYCRGLRGSLYMVLPAVVVLSCCSELCSCCSKICSCSRKIYSCCSTVFSCCRCQGGHGLGPGSGSRAVISGDLVQSRDFHYSVEPAPVYRRPREVAYHAQVSQTFKTHFMADPVSIFPFMLSPDTNVSCS